MTEIREPTVEEQIAGTFLGRLLASGESIREWLRGKRWLSLGVKADYGCLDDKGSPPDDTIQEG